MTATSAGRPHAGPAPASPAEAPEGTPSGARPGASGSPRRRRPLGWLGFAPFGVYVLLFLAIPGLIAVASGFFDADGRPTLANFAALADPAIQSAFLGSIGLSALSAVVSAVLGALICWALSAARPGGLVRAVVDSASSVFAQFGGVMLAFAFIATFGAQTLIQGLVQDATGFDTSTFLYSVAGLLLPYTYFGVPLMVLAFMPAFDGLKPQWGEAVATLGGTRRDFWRRVGVPVLAPAFLGSLILLFANAFSSYATAAALISQGGIITLAIRQQLTSETIVGVANTAGVLALGMVVIMAVLMTLYAVLDRRTRRWQR